MSDLMTTREASEYLKLSYMTLYKLAQLGEIPAYKLGGHWRFNRTVLDSWFAGKSQVLERNILLIGDGLETLEINNLITTRDNFKVTTVKKPEQAYKELERVKYSIVFLISKPASATTAEIISEIRRRDKKTTIVISTRQGDEPIALDVLPPGPSYIIQKPFQENDILKILHSFDSHDVSHEAKATDQLMSELVGLRQRIDHIAKSDNERNKNEESLYQVEEKLRRIMESSNDIFILLDAKFNVVEINKTATRYLPAGTERKDCIGKNILSLMPVIKGSGRYEQYLEVLRTGKPLELNDVAIDPAFGNIRVSARIFKVGNGLGIMATDITELKLLESLKESEEFSATLLDNAPHPILVYAENTRIRYANSAFETLTGFSFKEIEGLTIPYPWWQENTLDHIAATLKDPAFPSMKKLELQFTKKNGDAFWTEINTKTIMKGAQVSYYVANWFDITQRKNAEILLKNSEEKYRALVEQSIQGIMIIQDGRIVFANKALAKEAGYSVKQLLAFPPEEVFAFIHPDDRESTLERMRERLRGKKIPARHELRLVQRDGIVHWVDISSSLIEYSEKPAVQLAIAEITDRKKAEQALLQERDFSETIINSLPGVFYLIDTKGRFIRWNKNFEIETEYTADEISRMNPLDLFHKKDRPSIQQGIEKTFTDGKDSIEINAVSKSGRVVPYHLTGSRVILNDKTYLAGVGLEISERKQMEEEVRECEENLNIFLENSPNAMLIHDMEGKVLTFNKKAEELLSINRKDFIGKSILDVGLIGEEYLPIVIDGMTELKKGKTNKPIEIEITNRKGSRVTIEVTGFPITRDGKTQVCDIIRDVTSLKQQNKAPVKKDRK